AAAALTSWRGSLIWLGVVKSGICELALKTPFGLLGGWAGPNRLVVANPAAPVMTVYCPPFSRFWAITVPESLLNAIVNVTDLPAVNPALKKIWTHAELGVATPTGFTQFSFPNPLLPLSFNWLVIVTSQGPPGGIVFWSVQLPKVTGVL